ncbi:MAG: pilus assembly protein CpaB [Clostridium sp.]|nr:pilus assembly protein CpaB [Clostridium sp.]
MEEKKLKPNKKKVELKGKLPQSKVAVGIASILAAMLICFVLTPLYNQSIKEKATIVKVEKKIEKGQKVTEDMVKEVKVGKYNLSDNVIQDKSEVVGKYVKSHMYQDEYFIRERLSDEPIAQDEYLEGLDGTKGAISITIQSFACGLSGKLFPNDIVSLIVTDDKSTSIPVELKYVKVLACTKENGNDVDEDAKSESDEDEDIVADTITVLADTRQAKLLAHIEANAKIHVELVYRGSEKTRTKYLEQQDKINKKLEDKENGE